MKYKVKLLLFSILGILILGSSVAYAYSSNMITQQEAKENDTLISQKTEKLPDGNIYVEELYEVNP